MTTSAARAGGNDEGTAQRRAESLQAGQQQVLEWVATGRPLADVLGAVCRLIEGQDPGLLCSVLLPDDERRHIGLAVGPSLPESHTRGLVGLGIGPPYVGTCGEVMDCGKAVVVPDVPLDTRFAPEWRALLAANGLRSCRSTPVIGPDGTVLASFAVYGRGTGDPAPADDLLRTATHLVSIAIERARADRSLSESTQRLEAEVRGLTRLHAMGIQFTQVSDMKSAAEITLDVAVELVRADFGTVQLYDERAGGLRFLATRGFDPALIDALPVVCVGFHSPCAQALEQRRRVVVEDFETDAAGAAHRPTAAQLGYRAAQSTPLLDSAGCVVGMFTTHFRHPHRFSGQELRLIDLCAVQAATLIERLRASEALRKSEAQLKRVVEGSKEYAIIELDRSGNVVVWNSGAERLLGWTEADIVGRPAAVFLTPEDRAAKASEQELAQALETGRAESERWHRRKDGSRFWGSGLVMPLTAAGARSPTPVTGFVKVFQDRTAQREVRGQVERGQALLAELIERCPFGIYIVDADFRIRNMNGGSQTGAFANVRPVIGRPFDEAMRVLWPEPVAADIIRTFRHTLETGEPYYSRDFVSPRADTERVEGYEWELHRVPLPDGRPGVACYYYDSTELRATQAALKEADQRKDEFLATLAHELRNPLAPIRNGLTVLKAGRPEAAGRVVPMMDRQLGHMVRLIDDLLDVSRVSRGKVDLKKEWVQIRAVVEAAVETSRPIVEAGRHELSVTLPDDPLWLDADATRIAQVVSNLLNNSAKYTPDGGRIALTAERAGGEAVIRVADTGVGIPPDMLPRVFDLFTQVGRSLDRAQGGLGIGLSLVKKLVELHGGTIAADSPGPGRGSAFTVRLPLVAEAQAQAPERSGAAPKVDARRVLVVDDNADAADSLGMMLGLFGHATEVAHDGPAALEAAHTFRPDVVFLDIGMPGMNGYEVARALRQDDALAGTALVALTGWGSEDDKEKTLAAGFDAHLTKPVEAAAVQSVLARFAVRGERTRPGR